MYAPAAVTRTAPELTLTSHALAVPREIPNVDLNQLFEEYMYMSHISIKNCRHSESVLKLQPMISKIILSEDQVFA